MFDKDKSIKSHYEIFRFLMFIGVFKIALEKLMLIFFGLVYCFWISYDLFIDDL